MQKGGGAYSPGSRLSHSASVLLLILGLRLPLVLGHFTGGRLGRNTQDKIKPVDIHQLQRAKKAHYHTVKSGGLPLLILPVIGAGNRGLILGQQGPEGDAANVVAKVNPGADKEGEVGYRDLGVYASVTDAFPKLQIYMGLELVSQTGFFVGQFNSV